MITRKFQKASPSLCVVAVDKSSATTSRQLCRSLSPKDPCAVSGASSAKWKRTDWGGQVEHARPIRALRPFPSSVEMTPEARSRRFVFTRLLAAPWKEGERDRGERRLSSLVYRPYQSYSRLITAVVNRRFDRTRVYDGASRAKPDSYAHLFTLLFRDVSISRRTRLPYSRKRVKKKGRETSTHRSVTQSSRRASGRLIASSVSGAS